MKVAHRVASSSEKVIHHQNRMEECLCRMSGRNGIVLRVYAARFYDGIKCLVSWDSLTDGNPVLGRHDIEDVDIY